MSTASGECSRASASASAAVPAESVRMPASSRTSRASLAFASLSSTISTSSSTASSYGWAMAIRVVLAEDHFLVREGVRQLLENAPEIEVAAVCGDLDSLLASVESERPDVVVTDIRMPPGNLDEGIRAAEQLRGTHPDVGVVVL